MATAKKQTVVMLLTISVIHFLKLAEALGLMENNIRYREMLGMTENGQQVY